MNSKGTDKRIQALNTASQKKQQEALNRTIEAIDRLSQNNSKITVKAVAKEARVSVSYIYKYPEIAYKIQRLRDAQRYSLVTLEKEPNNIAIDLSKAQLEKEELIKEIAQLRIYIGSIEGKKKSTGELQKRNIQLQIENQELKREIEFTKQRLAETRSFILSQGCNGTEEENEMQERKRVVKEIT